MAGQQRTRADKARAQLHRQQHLMYTYQAGKVEHSAQPLTTSPQSTSDTSQSKPQKAAPMIADLFAYDVHLIYRDLLKTAIITGTILAVLIGIRIGIKV